MGAFFTGISIVRPIRFTKLQFLHRLAIPRGAGASACGIPCTGIVVAFAGAAVVGPFSLSSAFGITGGSVLSVGFGSGSTAHGNDAEFIDLTAITSDSTISVTYSGSTSSGTLTVSSGGAAVAELNFVGSYVTSNFKLTADSNGKVEISDPGATLQSATAPLSANMALLGNYIAASFATSALHGGTVVADLEPNTVLPVLAHPHA